MELKFEQIKYKNLLENINLVIKSDQITSIIGSSGSGKTSFLNLIYGLDLNFDGNILFSRKKLNKEKKNKDVVNFRKNIFYLPQDYKNELFNINVLEDIKYRLEDIKFDKLYEYFYLFDLDEEILKKNHSELSDGEIKKILIIIMLLGNYKMFLLDDPTDGLDQKSISKLIKVLKNLKREGKIIILVSQDSEFLLSVVDKCFVLLNKNIIEYEDKYKLFEDENQMRAFGLYVPNVLNFRNITLKNKGVKLMYRDNINDLLKDIYRNVK